MPQITMQSTISYLSMLNNLIINAGAKIIVIWDFFILIAQFNGVE